MRREKVDSGFTLVELVVVMVIIALMTAAAVPAFIKYGKGPGKPLSNSARILHRYLTAARTYAIRYRVQAAVCYRRVPGNEMLDLDIGLGRSDPCFVDLEDLQYAGEFDPAREGYKFNRFFLVREDKTSLREVERCCANCSSESVHNEHPWYRIAGQESMDRVLGELVFLDDLGMGDVGYRDDTRLAYVFTEDGFEGCYPAHIFKPTGSAAMTSQGKTWVELQGRALDPWESVYLEIINSTGRVRITRPET